VVKIKKIIVCMIALMLVQIVYGTNVGVITRFKDTTEQKECVFVEEGGSARDALDATNLSLEWGGSGSMSYLVSVNGVSSDYANNEAWSFWHESGSGFVESSVGFGGYEVSETGTIIGLSYSGYNPTTFEFLNSPTFVEYDELCKNMLEVKDIKVYVDDKKSSADEDGGTIKDVRPKSSIRFEIVLENIFDEESDIEIMDVKVEGVIESIDDGDDLEEESDDIDIDADEKEDIALRFDIPFEVDHGSYDAELRIKGQNERLEYKLNIPYKVKVNKERHELQLLKSEIFPETVKCGDSIELEISLANIGREEEDVELSIINNELGISLNDKFTLDDDPFDKDSKIRKIYKMITGEVEEGVYPLSIKAEYDSNTLTKTIDLGVKGCGPEEEIEDEEVVELEYKTNSEPEEKKEEDINPTIVALSGVLGLLVIAFIIVLVIVLRR